MTITADTLAAARRSQTNLNRVVDAEVTGIERAWSLAWSELSFEFEDAVDDLIKLGDGGWPTRRQIERAVRAQQALTYAADKLAQLGKQAGESISGRVRDLVASAEYWQRAMVVASLPGVRVKWTRVDVRAVQAIIDRCSQQIESLTASLSEPARDAMRRELVRGITVGSNPKVAARRMVERVQGRFNGGLSRATNIATTEMLDAYRDASSQSRQANSDVVTGWRWLASLDAKTCVSCLSMNGSVHSNDEHGPDDHVRGRCCSVAIVKPLHDLGILAVEPNPATFPDARGWFDRQPQATQLSIMGRERLRRYKAGELSWEQMVQVRQTPAWRRSFGVAPLNTSAR